MQVGLNCIEGELLVAVTLVGTKGEMLCEGFNSDMARHYASLLIQCADKLDDRESSQEVTKSQEKQK